MPELLEAEMFRRSLCRTIGWRVEAVTVTDTLVVPEPEAMAALITGSTVAQVRRHGKVVLVNVGDVNVGLRFGMTGRVIVGDDDPVPELAYGAVAAGDRFDRWAMRLARPDGATTTVRLSDPRRLARVVVDPDLSRLGPDAMALSAGDLAERLQGRRAPIKTALLDQQVVAGLGNLLADELLWRCGVAPHRQAAQLTDAVVARLARELPVMLEEMLARGGSHLGDLGVERRRPGGVCPVDGAVLVRRNIGGRTSWSCPLHQR